MLLVNGEAACSQEELHANKSQPLFSERSPTLSAFGGYERWQLDPSVISQRESESAVEITLTMGHRTNSEPAPAAKPALNEHLQLIMEKALSNSFHPQLEIIELPIQAQAQWYRPPVFHMQRKRSRSP
ncbi:unnamed protein product [Pleuronectes platessa]|uniref:Uncharacterized protein n=1 Tax=Pleuronectes platessa TaxID=8262 RepID=A0A9N7VKH2_PLEPL|nr:unnamed protein product [Pleuronectes platessa]